jgi:glycosyltransferase involved in cell wall biosynthesis
MPKSPSQQLIALTEKNITRAFDFMDDTLYERKPPELSNLIDQSILDMFSYPDRSFHAENFYLPPELTYRKSLMRRNKVTVVIIFLNSVDYLEEAIQSVLRQTWKNWELFLVNDGSTDGSEAIAKYWSSRNYINVKYLEHPGKTNKGMSASRNLGAFSGDGDFIAFLDSDDVWEETYLEAHLEVLMKHPTVEMVYCHLTWWCSWRSGNDFVELKRGLPYGRIIYPPVAIKALWKKRATASPHVLIRRQAFDGIGGFEESYPCVFEDQVFWSKVVLRYPIFILNKSLYRWRQHERAYHVVEHMKYRRLEPTYLLWMWKYLQRHDLRHRLRREIFKALLVCLSKECFRLGRRILKSNQ